MINFENVFPTEVCEVQGLPFIFSNARVDRNTIPEGLFVYDVRDDCDGEFWQIKPYVLVNHWATIIGFNELELDENQAYWCPPDEDEEYSSEGNMVDFVENYAEFKRRFYEKD